MSGCKAYADFPAPAGTLCGEPSSATVIVACAHEHIGERRYCAGCAVGLQRRLPSRLRCRRCEDLSSEPHRCRPQVIIRWDSGEVTRTEGSEWVTDLAGASR